ncbi:MULTISPECIES: hypothetical protein [unclassified Methylobacterium]|jgi:hypothetical protein|nr:MULTISPECIES: hypothetical protein [unclassified Methylobacterium]
MKTCPEGAFTAGYLWMAGLGGAVLMLVAAMILRDLTATHDP